MTVVSPITSPASVTVSFERICHSYDGTVVLDDITFLCSPGELLAVLGPSGCGKTTLLKIAAGLLSPLSGRVSLMGVSPTDAREKGMIGFAFQNATLLPWRTTLQNVMLPLQLRGEPTDEQEAFARSLIDRVGLADCVDDYPYELSGGMQQRASLARALVTRPQYVFLDEPFGALDGVTRKRLNLLVRELVHAAKSTSVFVTHSIEEAVLIADRALVLTNRPSRVGHVVDVDLGRTRTMRTDMEGRWWELVKKLNRLLQE